MICDHLVSARIIAEGWAATKRDVLAELAAVLATGTPGVPKASILAALKEREESLSTAIGRGVAMPHARIEGTDTVVLGLVRYAHGIPFDAVDGQPIHVAFGIVGPPAGTGQHVKLLASLARFVRAPGALDALRAAPTSEAMLDVLRLRDG